jgi:hypothetical protein
MPLVRWHLITCLLTLGLVFGLSVPAHAQRQLLSLDPALPIDGLSQADLDAVGPERLLCRNMLSAVNDMVALLERSPNPDSQYKTALSAARSSWPRNRGRCDAAVGDLDEGWPRSVLRQEFEQVMGLWAALMGVAQAHSSAAPSKEVEAALDNYQARLDGWREWLDRSLDFWAGAWLGTRPEPTCSNEAQTRGAALGKKIWLLATRPPEQRSDEATSDISIRLSAERDALDRCSGDTPLDTVTLALLRRRLAAYEEGLAGLKADDDPRIRRAMETEQRLIARAMRCRQEHERGSPSGDCSP